MEKIKLKFKNWLTLVNYFFTDIYGWCRSIIIICFKNTKYVGIFYGYRSFDFASYYAKKRTKRYPSWRDQSGKQQGVIPFNDTKLLVCSKLELEIFKKNHLLSPKVKPRKIIKKAYYKTEL